MKYKPEYAKNIIVGVIHKGMFSWYVTERDFWILDAVKRRDEYIQNGYGSIIQEDFFSFRFNIPIVNEETVDVFIKKIEDFKTESRELKELVLKSDYNTILELVPSLLVDFDSKILYSCYPETLPFERYVPDKWEGEYKDFFEYIPKEERYWIIGSIDYIKKIYDEEVN
ncbi:MULTISPECIES: hypothetical protein [Acetivibrio]|uniref:Group-specific protein n=1 Tax=Acetivibrio mesophilus TaxID=2487273 RepID=A0A4V1K1Q7_9FIRM|nr:MULTISPECIES: hypothetical protein [Acetivibrio]ODM27972.1 hypothetical protein A7W90_18150 [Clostridium sp. Bc-iso-3]RXE57629.1 hypothetical protein EFD62_16585 [Acetivibrio mesophilus]